MATFKDFIPEGEATDAQTDRGYSDFVPEQVKPEAPAQTEPAEEAHPVEKKPAQPKTTK